VPTLPLSGEAEDGDRNFLLKFLAARFAHFRARCYSFNPVLQRDRFPTSPSRPDRIIGSTIHPELHLQCHLNRMEPQIAILPLFGSLEHRQRHHVGTVQAFERLTFRMVLSGWTSYQGKASQEMTISTRLG